MYISSGVRPPNAECGRWSLCGITQNATSFRTVVTGSSVFRHNHWCLSTRYQDSINEFENLIFVFARTCLNSPDLTTLSTAVLKFSMQPSTSTMGLSEVSPFNAWNKSCAVMPGWKLSTTLWERIRREKLSATACE